MRRAIHVPDAFARKKIADEGVSGRLWIATLPGVLDELLQRWSCLPDGETMHGEVAVVVPVRHPDLPPAVIKVSFPRDANIHEPDAFTAWNGHGAVRLYQRADDHAAMLLERAAYRTLADVADPDRALTIQGTLSRRLAIPAPDHLPRLADQIAPWVEEMRTDSAALGHPLPRRVLDAALATVAELGPDQPDTLVHGDLHDANVVASERESWLAIDPKVYVGDPAYDALYVICSPRFSDLLGSADPKPELLRMLDIYCDAAEVDVTRARRWTQAGAVREALWGRQHDDPAWLVHAFDRLATALVW